MTEEPCIILLDNGSIKAASTINLRALSKRLATLSGSLIYPVSLSHSDKIPKTEIGDISADILEPFLQDRRIAGNNNFLILPLFFGQSAAVYEYVPQRLKEISKDWPQLKVRIAPSLVNLDDESDDSMAKILSRSAREKISAENLQRPSVAVVDHGTPRLVVNKVRNLVAKQLKGLLCGESDEVKAASMERRSGVEYEFNEPLLENLLGTPGFDRDVVVTLLFSSPGRHAGEGGDIQKICTQSELSHKGLRVFPCKLPSTDEGFVELLATRLRQALSTPPVIY